MRTRLELSRRVIWCVVVWVVWGIVGEGITFADDESALMKRRQQGILTGMPFMANVATRTFVDATGRKLFLANAPHRVVSMAPSITEIMFALGLDEALIAVTPLCDYPPAAQQKVRLGSTNPSVEQILALTPDVVLIPKNFLQPDLLHALERMKVPTFVVQAEELEEVALQIQMIARMFERGPAGDALAGAMRARIAAVKTRMQRLARPRVLYVLNTDPLQTVGPGSFVHQMLELAGGTNIASQAAVAYPRLALESVIASDPEFIVFPTGTMEGIPEEEQQAWRRWSTLSAVVHGRLVGVPSVLVDRPGPRLVEGLERLAEILHPESIPPSHLREAP